MNFLFRKNDVYLDYASTTPVSDSVKRAMDPFWSKIFFNPNGLYKGSVLAKNRLEGFRQSTASFFGVLSNEVIFTSGGTESNNFALFGVVYAFKHSHPNITPHIIVSQIEHPAVLQCAKLLETSGEAKVSYLSVDKDGVVLVEDLKKILTPETVLVSVMQVNNEIGSIQPLHEIAKTIRHFKKHTLNNPQALYPVFHTDASQGLLYEETNIQKIGVDMLSCNGGKIYGPKGVGVLIKKNAVPISPLFSGGSQEFGLRAGTHTLPLIAGFTQALLDISKQKEQDKAKITELHDVLVLDILKYFPQVIIHGSLLSKIPGILSISFPKFESELLILELDARGFALSSKTACKYDDPEESYVLKALGGEGLEDDESEIGTVRISIGRHTTKQELSRFVQALREVIQRYEAFHKGLEKKNQIG